MELTILGSGSPLPDPTRAGPSTLVRAAGRTLLFDCGRGVLMRAAAVGAPPGSLAAVLLTHLHSDHVCDFNDVVTTRWIGSFAPGSLPVVGPVGTQRFADATLAMLAPDIGYRRAHHPDLGWDPELAVTEVDPPGHIPVPAWEDGALRVLAAASDHRPVHPSVAYRIEADGRSAVIAGDTRPCPGLDALLSGADVYVQTVVRPRLIEAIGLPRLLDVLDYHSSIEDAGRTAAAAGVRTLVLNHPVPAPAPGSEEDWIDEAARHFDGEILLATDLLSVTC